MTAGWSTCAASWTTRRLPAAAAATTALAGSRTSEVPQAGADAARQRLLRPGVEVEPRRMWPPGMKDLGDRRCLGQDPRGPYGRAGPRARPSHRRRLGDHAAGAARRRGSRRAGHGPAHRRRGQGPCRLGLEPAPGRHCHRAVAHQARPDNEPRPADRAGRQAALPRLARLRQPRRPRPAPPQQRPAAALAVARSHRPGRPARGARLLTGPLLLIDDRIETGWTMTVAAKQLREAGAPAVLPLAFAVTTG